MAVSTRAKTEEPKKMKKMKNTSAPRLLAVMKPSKPQAVPTPDGVAKPLVLPKPKVAPKPDNPSKIAPKSSKPEKPALPPKPARRKSQPIGQLTATDITGLSERSKAIRSPKKRSAESPTKTLDWISPTEESFKRPVGPSSRRKVISSPKKRSSGSLPKTPGWMSPTEESFQRPVGPSSRRTSIYQKRIRKSLVDADVPVLSPPKTRRRSVYGVLASVPPETRPRSAISLSKSKLLLPPEPAPMVIKSVYEHPISLELPQRKEPSEQPKPQLKKRRPVCGVAALRRQSVVPELKPETSKRIRLGSATQQRPKDHVGARSTKYNDSILDKSVEIVEMELAPRTPPWYECDSDFFTPAEKALDMSLYETPSMKGEATPSGRLPRSVTTRRYKTPRRRASKMAAAATQMLPESEIPVHLLSESDEIDNTILIEENDLPSAEIINGDNIHKDDSSKCIVS